MEEALRRRTIMEVIKFCNKLIFSPKKSRGTSIQEEQGAAGSIATPELEGG
jgi:hypothetical protein